jgi:hypothetical protein
VYCSPRNDITNLRGIPAVAMPIFWLSKHAELSPYAKRIFGPGSYLPETAAAR